MELRIVWCVWEWETFGGKPSTVPPACILALSSCPPWPARYLASSSNKRRQGCVHTQNWPLPPRVHVFQVGSLLQSGH